MSSNDQHPPYERCRDHGCERPYCRIWREGKREGYEDARIDFYQPRYDQGHSDGYAEARSDFYQPRYDEGFADGVASARKS